MRGSHSCYITARVLLLLCAVTMGTARVLYAAVALCSPSVSCPQDSCWCKRLPESCTSGEEGRGRGERRGEEERRGDKERGEKGGVLQLNTVKHPSI